MEPLDVVNVRPRWISHSAGLLFIHSQFSKKENLCERRVAVSRRRFPEALDFTDSKGGLFRRLVDVAHALALHGLYIAVTDKKTDRTAQGIAGTAIGLDQSVFGRQKFLIGKGVVLYFHFQIFINIFVNTSGHFNSPFMFGQKYIEGFMISEIIIKDFPGKRNANAGKCLNKLQNILICYEDSMRNIDEIRKRFPERLLEIEMTRRVKPHSLVNQIRRIKIEKDYNIDFDMDSLVEATVNKD